MAWNEASDIATVASSGVGFFGTIIAICALLVARAQIKANSLVAQETNALTAHREYLQLCLQYPELSSSLLAQRKLELTSWNSVLDICTPESERYLWMLSVLLNTCEQIITAAPRSRAWQEVIEAQIGYHSPALEVTWPRWRRHYGSQTQKIVDAVLRSDVDA